MDQTSRKFRLGPPAGRRVSHFVAGLLVSLIGAGFFAGTVAMALEIPKDPALSAGIGIPAVLVLAGIALLFFYFGIGLIRDYSFRGACLVVHNGQLVLIDPRGLVEPIVVPLTDVIACSVDVTNATDPMPAFPVMRSLGWSGAYAPGAMSDVQGFAIEPGAVRSPILPMGSQDVNLLLLFNRPLRFNVATKVEGERRKLKVVAHSRSVVIPADDAAAVAEYLAQHGVRPTLETDDAAHFEPIVLENSDPKFFKTRWREMGWVPVAHVPTREPQVPQPIANASMVPEEFRPASQGPVQSNAIGLDAAAVSVRLKRMVIKYYVTMTLVIAAFAAAGVWVLTLSINLFGIVLIGAAGVLVWAVFLVKLDLNIEPTTVELEPRSHPHLWRMFEDTARRMNVSAPARTGVNFELTAGVVAQRLEDPHSGYDIEIGLPMLAILSERELTALIGHEYSHVRDDIARTGMVANAVMRAAIIAHSQEGTWTGKLVSPVTNRYFKNIAKLHRESEYIADRAAAELVGAQATASMLRKSLVADALLPTYWEDIVVPALEQGMHPPIVSGFRDFVRALSERGFVDPEVQNILEVQHAHSDEFSSHPSLVQRLANLGEPAYAPLDFADAALVLQDDGIELERLLLAKLGGAGQAETLRRVSFAEALPHVIRSRWTWDIDGSSLVAPGETVLDLSRISKAAPDIHVVASLFGLALLAAGGQLVIARPGDPAFVRINGLDIRPFETVEWLAKPETSEAEWTGHASRHGLAGIPLSTAPTHAEDVFVAGGMAAASA
jgi:Zn-dependent protease with chaperone function